MSRIQSPPDNANTEVSPFDALKGPSYSGEEFTETRAYLEKHRILDVIQQLMTGLVAERPHDPKEFMVRKLESIRAAKARNQNHVLFTRDNLIAIYKVFDVTGRGHITLDQYKQAMATIGATRYNLKPLGYGMNRINMDTFADEG